MAGDWIKMRTGLLTHPKVRRIASALKADKLRVIGGLFAVWTIFDEHTSDGALEGYTLNALDDELHWRGFGAAMQEVGWVFESESGLEAPEFDEHMSKSAKRRALDADRKRYEREADPSARGSWNTGGQASASEAYKKQPREEQEKRREEYPPPSAAPPTNPKPEQKARGSRKAPLSFGLTPERERWSIDNCPNVSAMAELQKFKDHTFKTAMTDWEGAWRNWMRKAAEFSAPRTLNGHGKSHQTTAERDDEARRLLGFGDPAQGDILDA